MFTPAKITFSINFSITLKL